MFYANIRSLIVVLLLVPRLVLAVDAEKPTGSIEKSGWGHLYDGLYYTAEGLVCWAGSYFLAEAIAAKANGLKNNTQVIERLAAQAASNGVTFIGASFSGISMMNAYESYKAIYTDSKEPTLSDLKKEIVEVKNEIGSLKELIKNNGVAAPKNVEGKNIGTMDIGTEWLLIRKNDVD